MDGRSVVIDEIQNLNCQRSTLFRHFPDSRTLPTRIVSERDGSRVSWKGKNTSGTPMPQCRGTSKIGGFANPSTQNLRLLEEFFAAGDPLVVRADDHFCTGNYPRQVAVRSRVYQRRIQQAITATRSARKCSIVAIGDPACAG